MFTDSWPGVGNRQLKDSTLSVIFEYHIVFLLKNIIKSEFESANVNEIVGMLAKHSLYDIIVNGITTVNSHLNNVDVEKETLGTIQITHISSSLLVKINEYLRQLKLDPQQEEEWENLRYILSGIFRRILIETTGKIPEDLKPRFAYDLYISLNEVCSIFSYDFEELLQFLGIPGLAGERMIEERSEEIQLPDENFEERYPHYIWPDHLSGKFEVFIEHVQKLGITHAPDEFRKLFEPPNCNLALTLNKADRNFVLQFFAYVNEVRIFTASYGGFYQVLLVHVVDFDGDFLNYRSPQRRIDTVKNHKSWPSNRNKFEECFKKMMC